MSFCVLSDGAAGGICEKAATFRDGKKKSLNTGVVTFSQVDQSKVTRKVSEITFAHQNGHSFGSPVSLKNHRAVEIPCLCIQNTELNLKLCKPVQQTFLKKR